MKKQAKNFWALLLAVLTVVTNFTFSLTTLSASAEELTSGIFTYEIVDGEVTITECDSDATGEVVVPSHLGGYPVTTIGKRAFSYCDEITKLVLPDTVIVIEERAFDGCEFSEIDFGDSVTRIGEDALDGDMDTIILPDSLIVLEEQSLYNKHIVFGNNLRYLGEDDCLEGMYVYSFTVPEENLYYKSVDGVLFSKDGKILFRYPSRSSLTSYSIPSTVELIHTDAFQGAKNLEKIIIPDSVKVIGETAFGNCTNLSNIYIGNGVEIIKRDSFYNTAHYNNPENWVGGIMYVGNCACAYNDTLPNNATIKNGTRLIAENCFAGASFATVDIPNTVKYICDYAFWAAEIENIELPDSVISLGYRALDVCPNLKSVSIGDGLKVLQDSSINSSNLTSVKFGSGLEFISETAMYTTAFIADKNNYNGNELIVDNYLIEGEFATNGTYYIGKDIKCIAEGAFRSCSRVTGFSVDADNPYFSTDEYGVLYNKDKTVLVLYPPQCSLVEYTVPSSVKKIGEYAFSNFNRTLIKLNLPEGLIEIGRYAFVSNSTIEEVALPDTLQVIGEHAFGGCKKLESVYLPDGIITIGFSAFTGCESIKSVFIPNSVTDLGSGAFFSCDSLETISIGDGVRHIDGVFDQCSNIKSVIFNNSIDLFEDFSFRELNNLSDIYYTGSKEQWKAIIKGNNTILDNVTIHYNHVIDDEPEVHKHSYSSTVTTEPTCESYGVRTYTCSCGKSYTEKIEKADHKLGDWVITKNPTVADYGNKVQYCSVCKNAYNETNVDKLPSSSYSDGSTGVEIIYPSDKGDFTAEIIMLTNGVEQDSSGRYVKYEIRFAASGVVQIKIPVPAGFIRNRTVGGFNSADGSRPGMFNVRYENGYLIFTVDKVGTFTVLEAKETYRGEIRTPSTTKISYGDSIILHLDANMALPSGYRVVWGVSNNNFDYTVSADGTTCTITPIKSGDTTFTVTVYDENGSAVSEDTQVMKSKAGFFDKLIAFFKKLFGLTQVIQQSIDTIY